jgi:quinol monooxygenase YgiN
MEGAMFYTTRHWVARPGHEDELAAGLSQLVATGLPLAIAAYVGRDVARPGHFVTFGVWADAAANDAFGALPETPRLVAEAITPHLDPDAGVPAAHVYMEPLP